MQTDGVEMRECTDCDGMGVEECEHCGSELGDCETCHGAGEVPDLPPEDE